MENKSANLPKTAVHFLPYPQSDPDMTASSYLVPIFEPIGDTHNHPQMPTAATNYQSAPTNVASALMPIAYSSQLYHGVAPSNLGVSPPGAVGPSAPQMVYATAATLEMANGAGPGCMAGNQQQQQFITFPMGYPYPYSG